MATQRGSDQAGAAPPADQPVRGDELIRSARKLSRAVDRLKFEAPVAYVYNPLDYAWTLHRTYLQRYAQGRREVLLVGINPGPFGMAQTGVPFGDARMVREFLRIDGPAGKPPREHPRRPVEGLACHRQEVSGRRFWGWVAETFGTPEAFFRRFLILNYCPLLFLAASGRNITPDKLPPNSRAALFPPCDRALEAAVRALAPTAILGIGRFAESRVRALFENRGASIGGLPHPSPANPRAREWAPQVNRILTGMALLP